MVFSLYEVVRPADIRVVGLFTSPKVASLFVCLRPRAAFLGVLNKSITRMSATQTTSYKVIDRPERKPLLKG